MLALSRAHARAYAREGIARERSFAVVYNATKNVNTIVTLRGSGRRAIAPAARCGLPKHARLLTRTLALA